MLKVHAEVLADVAVLRFQGHIVNVAETATLRDAVFSQAYASIVLLDLSRVDVIDAAGLGALLELRQWTQANRVEFRLVNPTKLVQQVFAITRLDSVFDISFQEDVLSAAARVEPPAIVAAPLQPAERRPIDGGAHCQPIRLPQCAGSAATERLNAPSR